MTAMADHPARIQLDGMILSGFPNVWCESEMLPRARPRRNRGTCGVSSSWRPPAGI